MAESLGIHDQFEVSMLDDEQGRAAQSAPADALLPEKAALALAVVLLAIGYGAAVFLRPMVQL